MKSLNETQDQRNVDILKKDQETQDRFDNSIRELRNKIHLHETQQQAAATEQLKQMVEVQNDLSAFKKSGNVSSIANVSFGEQSVQRGLNDTTLDNLIQQFPSFKQNCEYLKNHSL